MKNKEHFAIILCGGSGTRLWPYSRSSKPKQFLCFDDDKSLFQKTILRINKFFKNENIYIVTNELFYFETKGQLSDLSIDNVNIIREPESKNTLPAISYGVKEINKVSKNAIIGVFSSDHEIDDDLSFLDACSNAIEPVKNDHFVVFGIQPFEPNIGYGYIKPDKLYSNNSNNIFFVSAFVEKPNEVLANKYIDNGYFWNSGMFMFNSKVFLDALKKFNNNIYENIILSKENQITMNYANVDNFSIDYGLLEFIDNLVVVKVDFRWTDLGTWNSIHNSLNKDKENKFYSNGNVISEDVSNSLIMTNDHLVAAFGVKDIILVHDLDATLVCHKDKADDLKPFVDLIKAKYKKIVKDHPIVNRPWGHYKVLYEGETFKIKSIIVEPYQKLSLQSHNFRNEHWTSVRGIATVTRDDEIFNLHENESTYIKANEKHRLENNTDSLLELIEVSTGNLVSEDDIIRYDDSYGRT